MKGTIKCFCFPFAGGSKYSYSKFIQLAQPELEIVPIELPGHGSLVKEKLLTNIDSIVEFLFEKISGQITSNYIFYGHSMGSLVAYLLARRLIDEGYPKPMHLYVSGCSGPSMLKREIKRYTLPKETFLMRVKELGGIPEDIDEELLNFFEPIIRADFQAIETYQHEERKPIDVPITVSIGKNENVTLELAQTWDKETINDVKVFEYPGNHFFIFENAEDIIAEMKRSPNKKRS
ncbi:MAG: surfactin synthase thioesterase subunit [Cyclobacteriaceae bacterium]|jgi:surfactin synthase thioesterase subunit